MIRNHLKQMKVEQPEEYRRLMEGYSSEDDLIREVCGLSVKAIRYYYLGNKQQRKRKI
jgi:hypothetical protein